MPFWGNLRDHFTSLTSGACCGGLTKGFSFIFILRHVHNSLTVAEVRTLCKVKQKILEGPKRPLLGFLEQQSPGKDRITLWSTVPEKCSSKKAHTKICSKQRKTSCFNRRPRFHTRGKNSSPLPEYTSALPGDIGVWNEGEGYSCAWPIKC